MTHLGQMAPDIRAQSLCVIRTPIRASLIFCFNLVCCQVGCVVMVGSGCQVDWLVSKLG